MEQSGSWTGFLERVLGDIRQQGLERHLSSVTLAGGALVEVDGRSCVNLNSNDYLGLATDPELVAEFYNRLDANDPLGRYGPGATASRLMSGNHPVHDRLERAMARLYGREAALVFNSGYHANTGILPALTGRRDLILADKLCHASLVDGMRLSRARVIRYPHQDYARLETVLAREAVRHDRIVVVSESIFSMDGDLADLERLVRLKKKYGCLLYVDEAHAVGVRGDQGLGVAEEAGVVEKIDILLGTFGKAWGGQGAFAVCSGPLRDLLVNRARTLIYTTGLPPVNVGWLLFLLDRWQELAARRRQLERLASWLRGELKDRGLEIGGDCHIVPIVIGDARQAVQVADILYQHGFWARAVRPPTVPTGTSRLRLSLTAAMTPELLAPLPELLARIVA